jgi:tetratricopeptide (TPR) repeat protein
MNNTTAGAVEAALTPWRGIVALIVLTCVAYLGVLDNGFVGFDDPLLVTNNDNVRQGLTLSALKEVWTVPVQGNWTPLAWTSHMIDVELFGLWAGGHHISSVVIHALAAMLLFLAWIQQRSKTEGFFLALAFAIHPVHVESVAWISERRDVLSMLFFSLILLVWLNDRLRQSVGGRAAALILLIAALLSKSTMVTAPAVLVLLDIFLLQRTRQTSLPMLVLEKLPMLVAVAIVAAFTAVAQEVSHLDPENIGFRIVGVFVAYAHYVDSFIAPHALAALYPRPKVWPLVDIATSAAVLLMALATAVWRYRRTRDPLIPLGALWFGGTLIPMIGILQVGAQAYADRYLYFPSLGLFIFLWGLAGSVRDDIKGSVLVCWCLALTVMTSRQVEVWESNDALWGNSLKVDRPCLFALQWSGNKAMQRSDHAEALKEYRRALRFGSPPELAINIGYAEYRIHAKDKGRASFAAAVLRDFEIPTAHYWLGRINEEEGHYPDAAANYQITLGLGSDDASAWLGLGRVATRLGRRDTVDAVEAALLRLREHGEPAVAGFSLAALAWQDGRFNDAATRLDEVLDRVPQLVDAIAMRTAMALGGDGLVRDDATANRLLARLVDVEGLGARWVVLARLQNLLGGALSANTPDPWAEDRTLASTYHDAKWKELAARMVAVDNDKRRLAADAWRQEIITLVLDDALSDFEPTGIVESVHL